MAEWTTACSRVFFGDTSLEQPAFVEKGHLVCAACADMCRSGGQPRAVGSGVRTFACECAKIPEGICLFPEREARGEDRLHGTYAESVKASMRSAAQQLASRAAEAGRREMMGRLEACIRQCAQYEDAALQRQALGVIPASVQQIEDPVEKMRALLHWFKHEFFHWVNQAPCDACQGATDGCGVERANEEERRWGAGHTELYRCRTCQRITRFPRYNHAGRLLETRRGRCGEWAQAFTLCVRALQYDVRFVTDWTDHVWCEVWVRGRWTHCDPCEAAWDTPLLYESGWGKRLTYVIATSAYELVDVTPRYTAQWPAVLQRRTLLPEPDLRQILTHLAATGLRPPPQPGAARRRALAELLELQGRMAAPADGAAPAPAALPGRTSGAVEWRAARGELGACASDAPTRSSDSAAPVCGPHASAATAPSAASAVRPADATAVPAAATAAAPAPAPLDQQALAAALLAALAQFSMQPR